ncbi:polyprenyl synthetase family protein [Planctomonas psychrotolerans]|uniref:polyprenyl synthetase family protein n=1 Tax=Planctomonas psychrotolerans TaxID=2528712 RepID=UPI00123953D3|nr:polyprenyl synthetase family protein [Planctomonas psychrotolerans]
MLESRPFVSLVQSRLDDFLDTRDATLRHIGPDLAPFLQFSRDFLRGGKRFRASFCHWGWRAVVDAPGSGADAWRALPSAGSMIGMAGALEVFHAAALVHDDIIDSSDTRRGSPAAHRRFESEHRGAGWVGDAEAFGEAAAILLGDLLLAWSDELVGDALAGLDAQAASAARDEFNRMRTEVTLGQYLDVAEERAWPTVPESDTLTRARRVIVHKSARYSVEAPLVIGARLGGAREEQVESLRAFGLPLGIAYQLRDDLLGVFGDAAVTGKPSGDDLREGKRTVLIAAARGRLARDDREELDRLLGDPTLDIEAISRLQDRIVRSGAVAEVEDMIDAHVSEALDVLNRAPLSAPAVDELTRLADSVTRRTS